MGTVLEREICPADTADAGTWARKFLRMPGPFRGPVVPGRDHLAVADDDAAPLPRQAGGPQGGGEGKDHRVGRFVRPALLFRGMRLDRIDIGSGAAGTTGRWPRRPRGHEAMLLAGFENPGDRCPAVGAGAD